MTQRDIFLSHSSGDADAARELRAELEAVGYSCWMAPDDVDGTDPWAEQILSAIEDCRAMVILLSSNANRSPHVSREVNLALGRRRAVLPIRIENIAPEASLEYLLSLVQRVDAFPPPISNHRDRILRRLAAIVPLRPTEVPQAVSPPSDPPTEISAKEASDPATSIPAESTPAASMPAASVPAAPPPGAIQPPVVPAAVTESTLSDDAPPAEGQDVAPPIPPARPLAPPPGVGSRIGAFTIDSVVGEGGMATVYRATQDEPRRSVALKVIRADHAADAAYRARFLAEKDTLASLEHPSIVPIYAAGDADGVLYIAMRFVDGPDLAARLASSGPMSLAETIVTLRPIADAIDYAHQMGVVHRDIKPSNIILDRGDRPYLTDFGLGKHLGASAEISAPGVAVGTLEYMAPEQFSGLADPALGDRMDVYALGCVAYACLTGAPPFRADEPQRVMYGHLHGAIPNLRDARPDLPPGIDAALRQALAKNPADRFATADAFLAALTSAQALSADRTAAIVVPPGARGRGGIGAWARANSMLAGSAVTVAALLIVGTGVLAFGGQGATTSPRPDATKTAVNPGTTEPGLTAPPTLLATLAPGSTGATEPPVTNPPVTNPPATEPPTGPTKPPPPADTSGPSGGSISLKGNVSTSLTTSKTITVSITTGPQDNSGICARKATNSATRPSAGASGWVSYSGGKTSFSHPLSSSTYGKHTVYLWFRDCSSHRNVSASAVTDTIKFDHRPTVDNSKEYTLTGTKCSGSWLTLLPYVAADADGSGTIQIVEVWYVYNGTRSDFTISDDQKQVWVGASHGTGQIVFSFIVEDDDGLQKQGSFLVKWSGCP